jgi:hypothetical protein
MANDMQMKYPSLVPLSKSAGEKWEPNLAWYIQEKIDGSQLTFKKVGEKVIFMCQGKERSKEIMFANVVDAINLVKEDLNPDYTYHGEYVSKPKHNVLSYMRHPRNYVVIYDIETPSGYMLPIEMEKECARLDFEFVKILYYRDSLAPQINPFDVAQDLLTRNAVTPHLGGDQAEGVVVKIVGGNSTRCHKVVTSLFKEKHKKGTPKRETTTVEDIVDEIGLLWNTPARFRKAQIHLRESGIDNQDQHIGLLNEELDRDLLKEGKRKIKMYLWGDLRMLVLGATTNGFGTYYAEKYFSEEEKRKLQEQKKLFQTPSKNAIVDSPAKEFVNSVGRRYATTDRFEDAIQGSQITEHTEKTKPAILEILREEAETKFKEDIQEELFNYFWIDISMAARRDCESIFENTSNYRGPYII